MGTPRTVLHGVEQSCTTYAKLPGSGNMASRCFVEDLLANQVFDSVAKTWLPVEYIVFDWEYAVHGGTKNTSIDTGVTVPANTIILDGVIDVIDPITSGGAAKVAITVEASADVLAATLTSTLGSMGLHTIVPVGTAATAIRTTEDRQVLVQPTVANLRGGHFVGYLRCLRSLPLEEASSSSESSSSSASSASSQSLSSGSSSSSHSSSQSSKSSQSTSPSSASSQSLSSPSSQSLSSGSSSSSSSSSEISSASHSSISTSVSSNSSSSSSSKSSQSSSSSSSSSSIIVHPGP